MFKQVSASLPPISIYSISPKVQNFSLPENLIFYISKNPKSVKVYNKLVNACKYFYLQNPFITFENAVFYLKNLWCVQKTNGISFSQKVRKFKELPKKIWLNENLEIVYVSYDWIASFLAERIYRCDITSLKLKNQILTFNEFNILTSSSAIHTLSLDFTLIKYENGLNVAIENIIEILPKLEIFCYNFWNENEEINTPETHLKLLEIQHFENLKIFFVSNLRETFDFEEFLDGLKKPLKMQIDLTFFGHLSNGFIQQIQNYNDNVIKIVLNTENMPPSIYFPGFDMKIHKAIYDLRRTFIENEKLNNIKL